MRTEVLVPRTFIWWTVLALAAEPDGQYGQITFVDRFSRTSEVLIVHSTLVSDVIDSIHDNLRVIVQLWDGYQSYLETKEAIEAARQRTTQIELRAVGDLWDIDERNPRPDGWKLLFPQSSGAYDKSILSSNVLRDMVFPGPFGKLLVLYRSQLISLKVLIQLMSSRRFIEYQKTSFVFCGQSGLYTLQKLARDYGIDRADCQDKMGGVRCDRDFILRWVAAIVRRKEHWQSRIAAKALLRLIALRKLQESMPFDIFMNIYPEENLNAYQAGALFKRHVFLEFGGINGEELIYPRTADNCFHRRHMLRFRSESSMQRLLCMSEDDVAAASELVTLYEEEVLSSLRAHCNKGVRETAVAL